MAAGDAVRSRPVIAAFPGAAYFSHRFVLLIEDCA
jgi:hypothetical protein